MAVPGPAKPSVRRPRPPIPTKLIAIACLALIVLVGLAILITWLVIKPKRLQLSIDEGFVRNYSLNNTEFTSTFDFIIRTYNPNKKVSVYYDSLQVTLSYDGQTVSHYDVQPFFQPKRNVTRLRVQPAAQSVVLPGKVAQHLRLERTGGSMDLRVRIRGRIRFKVGAWKSHHYKLKAKCSPVVVSFNNAKRFQRTDCKVDI